MDRSINRSRRLLLATGLGIASVAGLASVQAQEFCGGVSYPFPYTDVSGVGAPFCPGIMEAYVTGISKGTTPTTFSPNENVSRLQMTTFLQRSLDQGNARTSRRAALDQWWNPIRATQRISVGGAPLACAADGEHIWIATSFEIAEVEASTNTVLNSVLADSNSTGVRVVGGKVYVAISTSPGGLYVIDPSVPTFSTFTNPQFGNQPVGIAFDGYNLWTANRGPPGSVTILDLGLSVLTTVEMGFNAPYGILFDGAHIWVTDTGAGSLLKLDSVGNILQIVPVGSEPAFPVFDGANIWVPNYGDNSITVVQASTGNVVATINSDPNNLLDGPNGASFDGERILVANYTGDTVSLFKAADLSFIAAASTGSAQPASACSDGISFWVPLQTSGELLRF
jgi:DNA-binding beta-propeller fold protein YncE